MTDPPRRSVARGVAWVAVASSLVAVLDLAALALILRTWVSMAEFGTDMMLEPVRFASGVVTVVAFPTFSRLRRDRAAVTALLWATVLAQLGLSLVDYLRRVERIPALVVLASIATACVHGQLGGAGAGVRLAVTTVCVLSLGLGLLAWLEGITPRAIARALRR